MRILAIADSEEKVLYEETKREKIGDIDLIISCGDLHGDYLSCISTMYKAPLFFVRGNHDSKLLTDEPVGENLHNKFIKYKGIRMLGFEGAPQYMQYGAVQYSDFEMNLMFVKAYFKSFLVGCPDIIVTHAPPKNVHAGDNPDHSHRGFFAYNKMINQFKPKYFLHGHNQSMFYLSYNHKYAHFYDLEDSPGLNNNSKFPWVTRIGTTTVLMIVGYCILNY